MYYKYSTFTSIPPLAMPSSGELLHAFASVRDCHCGVSTWSLSTAGYMNICLCFSSTVCAVPCKRGLQF